MSDDLGTRTVEAGSHTIRFERDLAFPAVARAVGWDNRFEALLPSYERAVAAG